MEREINELKKMVAEFTTRIAYETQQFERKFKEQVNSILSTNLKIEPTKTKLHVQVPQLPETGYLRLKQIIGDKKAKPPIPGIFPIAPSSWYKGIKEGYFPKPIKIGTRTSVWRVADIHKLFERS